MNINRLLHRALDSGVHGNNRNSGGLAKCAIADRVVPRGDPRFLGKAKRIIGNRAGQGTVGYGDGNVIDGDVRAVVAVVVVGVGSVDAVIAVVVADISLTVVGVVGRLVVGDIVLTVVGVVGRLV
ncbi:MAG: hypothetical protein IMY82_00100, partial [Chloroflexi bacterium]|nr:hypothetical protein [Chloroflexota bacterium]